MPRALAAQPLLAKTFRATLHASAAIHARASSGRIGVVDATADATIVAVAPIAVVALTTVADVRIAGDAPEADLVSNAGVPVDQDTTAVTREAVQAPPAVRSWSCGSARRA